MNRTHAWWWMLASLIVGCGEQDPKPDSGTPDSPEPTETGDTVADSPRDTVDSRAPDTQESRAPGETGETGDTAPDGPLDVRCPVPRSHPRRSLLRLTISTSRPTQVSWDRPWDNCAAHRSVATRTAPL